jgi:acetyl-CoA carboxylase carboxyl transferase subunit beta
MADSLTPPQNPTWFKRAKEGILTDTSQKKEAPDGIWYRCPACKTTSHINELKIAAHTCPACDYHYRVDAQYYFELLFDEKLFEELFDEIRAVDALSFTDTKRYADRLADTQAKTGLSDALRVAQGTIEGQPLVVAAMDFSFIGGSMGAVVGERLARAIDHARQSRTPLLVISRSGGARMMEGAFSLMQMAKTSAKLALLRQAGVPYLSLMTDPTTGGVTASFAMLGDLNLGEPGALIGFAGPRVIRETIGRDLPEGFQSAEFLLEKGFLDHIIDRKQLRTTLTSLLGLLLRRVPN